MPDQSQSTASRRLMPRNALATVLALVACMIALPVHAQTVEGEAPPTIDGTTGAAVEPVPQKPKVKAAAKPATGQKAGMSAEAQQRVEQLEEQLSDLQVVVGTLESLAKGRPSGGATNSVGSNGATTSDLDGRVRELEVRMQQISGQLAEISQQLRQMNAGGAQASAIAPVAPAPAIATDGTPAAEAAPTAEGFGQTTVTQEAGTPAAGGDPIKDLLQGNTAAEAAPAAGTQVASVDPATATAAGPQQAYEAAYGLLLQQDFAGAEQGFRAFLGQNADNPLNSEAQYFLGESHYVRGQYKPAAEAYLKGYSSYRQGKRAPDSLLKLAMSLGRLNQKDSACNAFTALDGEYPSAPANVKRRAVSERERIGC